MERDNTYSSTLESIYQCFPKWKKYQLYDGHIEFFYVHIPGQTSIKILAENEFLLIPNVRIYTKVIYYITSLAHFHYKIKIFIIS